MENKKGFNLNKDAILNTLATSLFIVGIVCIAYVLLSRVVRQRELMKVGNLDCVQKQLTKGIEDEHMAEIIQPGRTVRIFENFYKCNNVKRGDMVYFRFSQQIEPVVRVIRAIPGDKYSLSEATDSKGMWQITINGKAIESKGQPYLIKSNSVPPLKTYELSRGGVLAEDEYILLSSNPPGLSDSSNLGLAKRSDFIGKVILE